MGANFKKSGAWEAMEMGRARTVNDEAPDGIELKKRRAVYEKILEAIEMEEARRAGEGGAMAAGGGEGGADGPRIYWLDAEGNFPGKAELGAALAAEISRMASGCMRVLQEFSESGAAFKGKGAEDLPAAGLKDFRGDEGEAAPYGGGFMEGPAPLKGGAAKEACAQPNGQALRPAGGLMDWLACGFGAGNFGDDGPCQSPGREFAAYGFCELEDGDAAPLKTGQGSRLTGVGRPAGNITDFIIGARSAANAGPREAKTEGGVFPPATGGKAGDASVPLGRWGRAPAFAAARRKAGLKRGAGFQTCGRPSARDGRALEIGLLRGRRQSGFAGRGRSPGGAYGRLFKFYFSLNTGRLAARAGRALAERGKLKLRFMNGGCQGARALGASRLRGAFPKGAEPKILINFNIINARAEEEKINLIKLNSSSSAHAALCPGPDRKAGEISPSSSSSSSSHSRRGKRKAFSYDPGQALSSSAAIAPTYDPRPGKADPAMAIARAYASVEISQAIPCPEAPLKACDEGGEGDLNAIPPDRGAFRPALGSGKAEEEEEPEKAGESPAGGYYSRQGKVFYFANCRGGDEAVSASLVEYWREVFCDLDVDRELSGIAVWLKSNHAGGLKGGPMPGRERMEKYVANCLRVAARAAALNRPKSRKRSASPQDSFPPSRLKEFEAIYSRALEARAAGSRK